PGAGPPASGQRPGSSGSSSSGNANTSVGPLLPRKRSFKPAMVSSSTNSTESSASPLTFCALSTRRASLSHRGPSTGWSLCSSATNTSMPIASVTAAARRFRVGRVVAFVGRHDVGDDLVADDVALAQPHEGDVVDAAEYRLDALQSRLARRQVD